MTAQRPRKKQKIEVRPHGWIRASDAPELARAGADQVRDRLRAPAGTSLLLFVGACVLGGMGIVKVQTTTRVLEVGGEITQLTEEQARLLEKKRRLTAERAYLRHPDQIEDVARERLGMVPIAPELVQQIRIVEEDAK